MVKLCDEQFVDLKSREKEETGKNDLTKNADAIVFRERPLGLKIAVIGKHQHHFLFLCDEVGKVFFYIEKGSFYSVFASVL